MEVIKFPKNVIRNKYYQVPCVRIPGPSRHCKKDYFVPINSYLHEDSKIINFYWKHWHIDWRFMPNRLTTKIVDASSFEPAYMRKIGTIVVFDKDRTTWLSTDDSNIYYKKIKCIQEYNANDFFDKSGLTKTNTQWITNISKCFKSAKLKQVDGELICPHKGIVIDKSCKDEHGNYVCPGHLLRFNSETHECIPNKSY
jgi:hypothetical protein